MTRTSTPGFGRVLDGLHPWLRLGLPVLLLLPAVLEPRGESSSLLPLPVSAAGLLGAGVVVLLRRRFPRRALAAGSIGTIIAMAVGGPYFVLFTAVVVVMYSLARHTDRRTNVIAALTTAAVIGASTALLVFRGGELALWFLQPIAFLGFAAALGEAGRVREAYVDAISERARRAEESMESEARNRVTGERLKIARDLHDVLAHQIAVITMHANVASMQLRTRPDDAERSLATVREASRTVLAELGSLLQVLRSEEPAPSADLAPVAGLHELDTLVAEFARDGLRVEQRILGPAFDLPTAVDIVAYQGIREGLTNALKHGADSSALLQVEYAVDALELTVVNTVAGTDSPRQPGLTGGHGLLGVRERVAAVHGTFRTERGPGPVYRFTLRLPLSAGAPPAPDGRGDPTGGDPTGGGDGTGGPAADPAALTADAGPTR